jgi:hypothetical protein
VLKMTSLEALRRSWWFPSLDGIRPSAPGETYHEFDLDLQPRVDSADPHLSWLEVEPEQSEWAIDDSEATPQRRLNAEELTALVPPELPVPVALSTLAARPDLQRKIRSATGCYLDLGDVVFRTSGDGSLIHFLSDQQWVRHWLVLIDTDGREAVVSTAEPVGFLLPDDWDIQLPELIPLDGSFDLQICADSVGEFFKRFWMENELFYATIGERQWTPELASYAATLQAASQ